jgi:hypothetical protein
VTKPMLIGGPYRSPRFEIGSSLVCRLHGRVTVHSVSEAPARWPQRHQGSATVPVFTSELVRAVRTESSSAICYHWGVNRKTVTRWRRALGVPRFNLGTLVIWSRNSGKLNRQAHTFRGAK